MSKAAAAVIDVTSALSGQCKMTIISVLEKSKRPVSGLILITGLAAINQAFAACLALGWSNLSLLAKWVGAIRLEPMEQLISGSS